MAGAQIVACENDPNFGIIISFMERFGAFLDIGDLNIAELKAMLESTDAVPQALVDLHIRLMRKINKKVPAARWELALAKFAHTYSHQDAWEIERFGYKTANLPVKLRVLKALLEGQFDLNTKFKAQINTTGAAELRLDPLGRDRQGNCYWYFMDESANLQIYQTDPEMETWTLVARNRDEFVNMIEMLKENRPIEPLPAANLADEEDDSMSESEAMKLDTSIPAPTEVPPSLIISRRTYKTPDQMDVTPEDEEGARPPTDTSDGPQDDVGDTKPEDTKPSSDLPVKPPTEAVEPGKEGDVPSEQKQADLKTETVEPEKSASKDDEPATEVEVKREAESKEDPPPEGVKMEVDEAVAPSEREEQKETEPVTEDAARIENESGVKHTNDLNETEAPKPEGETKADAVSGAVKESLPSRDEPAKDEAGQQPVEATSKPPEVAVSEAIEDPPLVVKGEGNGADCDGGPGPLFSDVIEEPVMFFFGVGAGVENDMGNTKKVETATLTPGAENASESSPTGSKKREDESDGPTRETVKAGNGEKKSSPRSSGVKTAPKASPEAAAAEPANAGPEDGENDAGPPRRRLSTKEKDTMDASAKDHEPESEQSDNGDGDAKTASRRKANKQQAPIVLKDKPPAPRGKRSDANESTAEAASVVPEKPVEKKRGSRKSNTPKKAAASLLMAMDGDDKDGDFPIETKPPADSDEEKDADAPKKVESTPDVTPAKNGDHRDGLPSSIGAVKPEPKEESTEVDPKPSGVISHGKKAKPDVSEESVKIKPETVVEGKVRNESGIVETPVEKAPKEDPVKVESSELEETLEEKDDDGKDQKDDGGEPTEGESPPKRKRRHRNGLVDGLDISMVLDAGSDGGNNPPVRQSRRIAMQKIKEETNRREIEDQMLKKMKADAVKKKKDLGMKISDDDYRADRTSPEHSDSSSDGDVGPDGRRRKKKKKRKKKGSLLQQQQQLQQQLLKKQSTWNSASSSESSSETEAEDYFAEPYHSEEDVRRANTLLKSDHEFSPESDLETEAPAQPLKRARTARKARRTRDEAAEEEEEEEEEEDDGGEDHACQECKKTDQPEWILLCDSCDKGYHCACLKPVLFTIPEGDWFCPVCLHRQLIERLQSKLVLFDALRAKLEADEKRRQAEEASAREAELAEQALANEREEQLRAERRARQQQRLLERAEAEMQRSRSGSDGESTRDRRRRRQRHRNRRARKGRSRSRSGDSGSGSDGDDGSGSESGGSDGASTEDSDDIPIYKLRRRASAKVSYKFNEYDSLIDSAIRREMRDCEVVEEEEDDDEEAGGGGGGGGKGKDISTIIEATTREERKRRALLQEDRGDETGSDREADDGGEERRVNGNGDGKEDEGDEKDGQVAVRQERKPPNRKKQKKKKKLCKIELSSEEEDDSDEDFRGDVSGSDDDEEEEDDDEDDEDENSLSGESESSLDGGRGRNRLRKPSNRTAASKRRRIVENSDDSDDVEEERHRAKAKKARKNRVLDDSDEELELDDDDDEDSEDYDSDDLCSDTETESSRSSSAASSSSSAPSTEGDWRRKRKSKGGKPRSKAAGSAAGGGGGGGKHLERPKKPAGADVARAGPNAGGESSSEDSDRGGKGGKTMPGGRKKPAKKPPGTSHSPDSAGRAGEKKSDRKTRGKKIHYIVDEDFESSDDGIRPGVERPDTPPEEREQFIRRQEEIKRMLAENNAAKAKELATSKIDQLVAGGPKAAKDAAKDSLSDVPMQVIESARILDIDFLKSTSGNTARIATVDSVVDFDDELPEDFDPDDEMDDEALAKIMEEEDFAHHQPKGAAPAAPPDLLLPPGPASAAKVPRKSVDPPEEFLLQQQARGPGGVRKDHHPPGPSPMNLASPAMAPHHPHAPHPPASSPIKALLKPTGIPTSTIMPPGMSAAAGTILANALQTAGLHPPTLPPPPLLKEPHPHGRPEVLMRAGPPPHGPPVGLHHKPELAHLMALGKGGVPLPPHHVGHRLPPGGLAMPPTMLGHHHVPHGPPSATHVSIHGKPGPVNSSGVAAAIGGGAPGPGVPHTPPPASPTVAAGPPPRMPVGATPPGPGSGSSSERRPGRRKKITPLREDLKRKGGTGLAGESPTAAHQEQHQRPPPQHPSQHHGHVARLPPPPMAPSGPGGAPVGLRPSLPPPVTTSSHNAIQQSATAIAAAAAAAAAAAQELAIKVHSRPSADGGGGASGAGLHVNEPPLSVPSSVAHLSYLSENPLFAHRLGPLPSSILSSGSSSLQRIAAISTGAPPTVFGDPAAYNGGWKPPPPGSKPKSSGGPPPPGMMVGPPPPVGSLDHYHDYNPANHHYNPYYNVLDRAHLRPPPTIGELHRTSALSPTTFTTLQPLEFPHVLKPTGENHHQPSPQQHHHHHSATSSPASTVGDDGPAGDRLGPAHHGPGSASGPPPAHASSSAASEAHPSMAVSAPSPPSPAGSSTSASGAGGPTSLMAPSVAASAAPASSSSTSTSVFGELVSYFSSQQDDLDS